MNHAVQKVEVLEPLAISRPSFRGPQPRDVDALPIGVIPLLIFVFGELSSPAHTETDLATGTGFREAVTCFFCDKGTQMATSKEYIILYIYIIYIIAWFALFSLTVIRLMEKIHSTLVGKFATKAKKLND